MTRDMIREMGKGYRDAVAILLAKENENKSTGSRSTAKNSKEKALITRDNNPKGSCFQFGKQGHFKMGFLQLDRAK